MKKRIFFTLVIISSVVASCCKETIRSGDTLIGDWKIDSISKYVLWNYTGATLRYVSKLPDTTSLHFNSDSLGYFLLPLSYITDTVEDFIWHHDTSNHAIDFFLESGTSIGILRGFPSDTIVLYFRDYLLPPNGSHSIYYQFCMHRLP